MTDDSPRPFGTPAQRTPVELDADTGHLRIGSHARPLPERAEPSQVYSAYLSLLYAVRGARPGEELSLRSADLEALLLIVGDDPETIQQRLIALMGCTADEATALSRVLLRHRKLTATLGIVAGLSLGIVATATPDSGASRAEQVQSVEATSPSALRTSPSSTAGENAASPVPAPTSVVLAAAEVPTGGAAFSSSPPRDGGSGSADRRTSRTGPRPVIAATQAPPTGGARTGGAPAEGAPTGGAPIEAPAPTQTPVPADSPPTETPPGEPAPSEPVPSEPVPSEPAPSEPAPTPSPGGDGKKPKGGGLQGVVDGDDADKGKGNEKR